MRRGGCHRQTRVAGAGGPGAETRGKAASAREQEGPGTGIPRGADPPDTSTRACQPPGPRQGSLLPFEPPVPGSSTPEDQSTDPDGGGPTCRAQHARRGGGGGRTPQRGRAAGARTRRIALRCHSGAADTGDRKGRPPCGAKGTVPRLGRSWPGDGVPSSDNRLPLSPTWSPAAGGVRRGLVSGTTDAQVTTLGDSHKLLSYGFANNSAFCGTLLWEQWPPGDEGTHVARSTCEVPRQRHGSACWPPSTCQDGDSC